MDDIAKRMDCIRSSGIRKVFDLAKTIKDPINLSIGQPDFPVPDKVKTAMIDAINNNQNGYTVSQGLEQLRDKVKQKLKEKNNIDAESVMITSGVSGGLFLLFSVLLENDDEIIIFDPYFVMYPDICEFLGAKPIYVKTNDNFTVNLELLKKAVTPKTKAILVNSPNNPTGHVMSIDEIKGIVEIAKENNLWIISDEIYEDLIYDGKHYSPASFYDKTITLNGMSKNMALAGLRIGYAAGPTKIIDAMVRLQQYTFVCPPSIVQFGALASFDCDITEHVNEYSRRAQYVYDNLKDHFELEKPSGAFYSFVKAPEGINTSDFVLRCIKNKVLIIPGNIFSKYDTHFRISFATDIKSLDAGIKKIIETKDTMLKELSD